MSDENERTQMMMVASFYRWSALNAAAVRQETPAVAMNAASAAGLCLVATQNRIVAALEFAMSLPRESHWVEAVRYLTVLAQDQVSDTQPAPKLSVVR